MSLKRTNDIVGGFLVGIAVGLLLVVIGNGISLIIIGVTQ